MARKVAASKIRRGLGRAGSPGRERQDKKESANMTKADFIKSVQQDLASRSLHFTRREAETAIETVLGNIRSAVEKDGGFSWRGFGSFKSKVRAARRGHNPATGQPIDIPAKTVIDFKAADNF